MQTREYYKLVFFVVVWIGAVLLLLALIAGRFLGYKDALIICFAFWLVIVAVFAAIILCNLIVILFYRVYTRKKQ